MPLKKELLSIKLIGKARFYFGILIGLSSALMIHYFSGGMRESLRFLSSLGDLIIPSKEETIFFNSFFASISAILGTSMMLYVWLFSKDLLRINHKAILLAQVNAIAIFWLILMMLTRLGSVIAILPYSLKGYDNHLDLYSEFSLLFILLPIVVFLHSWYVLRLSVVCGGWMLKSFGACLVFCLVMSSHQLIDPSILTNSHYKHLEDDLKYIDSQNERSIKMYGVSIDAPTIAALKLQYAERTVRLVDEVKASFSSGRKLSLDTILIHKIIVHNDKQRTRSTWRIRMSDLIFATPMEIYNQLQLHDNESWEYTELLGTLRLFDLWIDKRPESHPEDIEIRPPNDFWIERCCPYRSIHVEVKNELDSIIQLLPEMKFEK